MFCTVFLFFYVYFPKCSSRFISSEQKFFVYVLQCRFHSFTFFTNRWTTLRLTTCLRIWFRCMWPTTATNCLPMCSANSLSTTTHRTTTSCNSACNSGCTIECSSTLYARIDVLQRVLKCTFGDTVFVKMCNKSSEYQICQPSWLLLLLIHQNNLCTIDNSHWRIMLTN